MYFVVASDIYLIRVSYENIPMKSFLDIKQKIAAAIIEHEK